MLDSYLFIYLFFDTSYSRLLKTPLYLIEVYIVYVILLTINCPFHCIYFPLQKVVINLTLYHQHSHIRNEGT